MNILFFGGGTMSSKKIRHCPLCNCSNSKISSYPSPIKFNLIIYKYLKCDSCKSKFLNPIPTENDFLKIYEKNNYHDLHYSDLNVSNYTNSVNKLIKFIAKDALVLDFGCGDGKFLTALKTSNFIGIGVEFNLDAATQASINSGCEVFSLSEFKSKKFNKKFDVIHLGDVLEHLTNPSKDLKLLCEMLKPDGIFFIEGPLEANPSIVYWAANLFGILKRYIGQGFIGEGIPTHLFILNEKQQFEFLSKTFNSFELLHWSVYESGWPYLNNGFLKSLIANISIFMSGFKVGQVTFGNRFQGIFKLSNLN